MVITAWRELITFKHFFKFIILCATPFLSKTKYCGNVWCATVVGHVVIVVNLLYRGKSTLSW